MKRKPKRPFDHIKDTRFGFEYGNMNVERAFKDPKSGNILIVSGRNREIVIRTTPSGLLRD